MVCTLLCSFPKTALKVGEIMTFTEDRFEVNVTSLHATTRSILCCAKSLMCITEWLAPNWLKSFKQFYTWEKNILLLYTNSNIFESLNQIVHLQSHHVIFKRIKLETIAYYSKEMELVMFKPLTGTQTSLHTVTLPPSSSKFSKQYIPLQKCGLSLYFIAASNSYKSLNYMSTVHVLFSF